jgi:hypothetical protein
MQLIQYIVFLARCYPTSCTSWIAPTEPCDEEDEPVGASLVHGDEVPSREPLATSGKLWLDKLGEVDEKRARYQETAAEDLISFDDLRARVAELDEIRRTADQELRTFRGRQEQIRQLKRDKESLLEDYAGLVPQALDELNAAECSRVYAMLRVEAQVAPEGSLEIRGDVISVCEMELLSL